MPRNRRNARHRNLSRSQHRHPHACRPRVSRQVLEHHSQHAKGELWLQVLLLNAVGKDGIHTAALLKQHYRKAGRPDYFPKESRTEPVAVSFNRIPATKRTDRNADTLIGELWDADGLWTLLIKPSKSESVLYAGSAVPGQAELANPSSKIAQYQRPGRPARTHSLREGAQTFQRIRTTSQGPNCATVV
jgi:hypothetical protein